jgi:hypothetical protein
MVLNSDPRQLGSPWPSEALPPRVFRFVLVTFFCKHKFHTASKDLATFLAEAEKLLRLRKPKLVVPWNALLYAVLHNERNLDGVEKLVDILVEGGANKHIWDKFKKRKKQMLERTRRQHRYCMITSLEPHITKISRGKSMRGGDQELSK